MEYKLAVENRNILHTPLHLFFWFFISHQGSQVGIKHRAHSSIGGILKTLLTGIQHDLYN